MSYKNHIKNFSLLLLIAVSTGGCYKKNDLKIVPMKEHKKIIIFSRKFCSFCAKAKNFLKERKLSFTEIPFHVNDPEALKKLKSHLDKSSATIDKKITVPQIFIGDHYVGGYSELNNLSELELNKLLSLTPAKKK